MEYIESRGVCLWLRRYLPFTRKLIQQPKIDRLVSIVIITYIKRLLIGGWVSYRSIHFLDNLLLFVSVQKPLTRFELLRKLLNLFFYRLVS